MRSIQEKQFTTHDGTILFYRHWPAASTAAQRRALVLFHRGHEHSGRLQHLVDELGLDEFDCFAWDARGHGRSPGPRGFSPSFGTSVKDVDTFVGHISETYGIALPAIAVIAQSVGAVLAATWVHDYAPPIRALVLASPAFKVKLYVPLARPGLRLLQAIRGNFYVNSYVKAKFLTHDPQRIASYESDPLITRPISVNILLALYETAERIVADASAIRVPTQLLISGADWVVHQAPQRAFFEHLGSEIKECHVLPGFYHDTLGELERERALVEIRRFIAERFATPAPIPSERNADREGPRFQSFAGLQTPPPIWSPRAWYWAVTRLGLAIGSRLSAGLRLSRETGFDSGSTLDYVYRNQPTGLTPIGRLIDWTYLNSIGWRGIRVRRQHLQKLLNQAIDRLRAQGKPVRLVDIAAGHGRYILETVAPRQNDIDQLLLRDYSELNVTGGRALIGQLGLEGKARFEAGDAFDRASLAALSPRPTLAVVSGLYELFPENALLERSLAGLADAVEPGGLLIYTNQPWHPQLELIARALTSHRGGSAWVMRCRSQLEMDQLVTAAGFRKLDQLTDDWGIFTVSVAVREAARDPNDTAPRGPAPAIFDTPTTAPSTQA